MIELSWFPFYTRDWALDIKVRLMGPVARAYYAELLRTQWEEGSIPDDRDAIRKLLTMPMDPREYVPGYGGAPDGEERDRDMDTLDYETILSQVLECFELDGKGGLQNRKLNSIRLEQIKRFESKKKASLAGNRKRWAKSQSDPSGIPMGSQPDPYTDTDTDTEKDLGSVDVVGSVDLENSVLQEEREREAATPPKESAQPIPTPAPVLELVPATAKKKRSRSEVDPAFQAPTLEEITQFVNAKRIPIDAYQFYAHYENTNWRYGRPPGYPIRNWHMLAYKWGRKETGRAN